MALALRRQGHAVALCCVTGSAREVEGVRLLPHQGLSSYLRDRHCDVFISSRSHRILRQPLRANLVGMWHHDMPCEEILDWMRPALARSAFSFFVSRFQLESYERHLGRLSDQSLLTTNGVDFETADLMVREAPQDRSCPRFLYASRPERGLLFLLDRIWPRIRERHPDAELLVTTYSGAQNENLRPYYEACDLLLRRSAGVLSLGSLPRRDFWRTLAGCTALIYPTDFPETSCMVALEAQALGVPVVTSGRFALPETVACAETLVREPWGSAEYVAGFVETVSRLVEDHGFAQEARAQGLRHVCRERYSWDAIAARWTEHFERLFAERFATRKAGALRRLLRNADLGAALHLVESEPAEAFDPADLEDLRLRAADLPRAAEGPLPARLMRTPPLPKISATLLVKNEESHLKTCIESIAGVVDEIILGDTGSTDRTLAIAEEMGFERAEGRERPELLRRRLVSIEFRDFAQARNDLAQHATGDYIFWQDADEILVHPGELRKWVDDNVYYDGFCWEQRHALVDGQIEPDRPTRCFKRNASKGSPGWFGCIHEVIEYQLNQGLERIFPIGDVYLAHVGYLYESVRSDKSFGRNFPLLVRDRIENPDRCLGFILGMREYLSLAKLEIGGPEGAMTEKAYRYQNHGFEIWDQHIRHFAEPYRKVSYGYSREILALLARFRLPLHKTGRVPFQANLSVGVGYEGNPGIEGRLSGLFSSIEELREAAETNLKAAETWIGSQAVSPPRPIEMESAPALRHLDLPPELFGLAPSSGGVCSCGARSPEHVSGSPGPPDARLPGAAG
ncbi:MAG: glycosyltransferase [Thermoanaerobaculia bacterium]